MVMMNMVMVDMVIVDMVMIGMVMIDMVMIGMVMIDMVMVNMVMMDMMETDKVVMVYQQGDNTYGGTNENNHINKMKKAFLLKTHFSIFNTVPDFLCLVSS